MTLEEELEIVKTRILEEINSIDQGFDDLGYTAGLKFALDVIEQECSYDVTDEPCRNGE